MNCVSCDKNIDPTWSHAIDKNICPFCGQVIMNERLKDLLSVVKSAMEELSEFQLEIDDWLLHNYKYVNVDRANLISFIPKDDLQTLRSNIDAELFASKRDGGKKYVQKIKTEDGIEEVEVQKIKTDEDAQSFQNRAFMNQKPTVDIKNIKNIVNQIKSGSKDHMLLDNDDNMDTSFEQSDLDSAISELSSSYNQYQDYGDNDDMEMSKVMNHLASKSSEGYTDNSRLQQQLRQIERNRSKSQNALEMGTGSFSKR